MKNLHTIVGMVAMTILFTPLNAYGQTSLARTKVVDASGNSTIKDYQTIQEAVDSITSTTQRWTILVYSGVYPEEVSLPSGKMIDLVGTDRDGVIIAPTTSANGAAIVCNGTNSIRNLSVKPTANHGIVLSDDGEVSNVTVVATATDKDGIDLASKDRIRISNSKVTANRRALQAVDPDDLLVQGCEFRTNGSGAALVATVRLQHPTNTLFQACNVVNDGSGLSSSGTNSVIAFFLDGGSTADVDITLQSCKFSAKNASLGTTIGINNDMGAGLKIVDCTVNVESLHTTADSTYSVYGVRNWGTLSGCSIATSSLSPKRTEVFDIFTETAGQFMISGTTCSKWKGPIGSTDGKKSNVQRILSVPTSSSTAVRAAYTLDATETTVTSSITGPTVYRVLSVTGNTAGMTQAVYVVGTDWAGKAITDKITLNGTATVTGKKPFRSVTSIIFPAKTADGQTVSVGTTSLLGLYVPIESSADVIQQARKVSAASSYTIESVGTIDATYGTVSNIVAGSDSFEWVILTGK